MRKIFSTEFITTELITTGLAIFSMLFGAGNLIFPLKVGLLAGNKVTWAMFGFLLTAILIPLMGLVALILYDGDYETFFKRLGDIPGSIAIFLCMLTIGPFIVMPRIVTLSHVMIAPFLGNIGILSFSILFLFLTFLGSYRESGIIRLLGTIVSPLLIVSLAIIMIKGLFFTAKVTSPVDEGSLALFFNSLKTGYNTLDLLGTIFFSAIVISILKQNQDKYNNEQSIHKLAVLGFKAGAIGVSLLAIVYLCMGYLGALHGAGLEHLNEGELFSAISERVLGCRGAVIIAVAVFMACYSTVVALAAVLTEYVSYTVTRNKLSYVPSLIFVLVITSIVSNVGLTKILEYSVPIIEIGYPVLIVITACNILYKVVGFKPIKVPALITLGISIILYRM